MKSYITMEQPIQDDELYQAARRIKIHLSREEGETLGQHIDQIINYIKSNFDADSELLESAKFHDIGKLADMKEGKSAPDGEIEEYEQLSDKFREYCGDVEENPLIPKHAAYSHAYARQLGLPIIVQNIIKYHNTNIEISKKDYSDQELAEVLSELPKTPEFQSKLLQFIEADQGKEKSDIFSGVLKKFKDALYGS